MEFLLVILILVVLVVLPNVKIVPQAKSYVVERLGSYYTTWNNGLHVKIPFVDRIANIVTLKEIVKDFAPQPVITSDNVTMQIDTVVYFQITDAKLYTYEKLHCYSFMEKPFNPDKLKELVKQCLKFPFGEKKRKTMYFRKDGIILATDREDIVYVECVKHVLHIHTVQGDLLYIPYVTLKKFLSDADSVDFIQCSRSSVVNRCYIHHVDITNRIILLKNQMGTVEIGITYKTQLREIFK